MVVLFAPKFKMPAPRALLNIERRKKEKIGNPSLPFPYYGVNIFGNIGKLNESVKKYHLENFRKIRTSK